MFEGLCAFPLTRVSEDRVDEPALAGLVARIAATPVRSIGVLGSTGMYPYLSRDERRGALRAAVEAAGAVPVVAGVGALRTRDVLAHADDAQAVGAAALLLAPVSYQRLTADEVYGLYRDVASAVSVPVVVYDNPTTTGFTFTDDLHARIAALPNIAAVKIPPPPAGTAAERLTQLRAVLPGDTSVGISGDWAAAEALAAGCDGWYSVIAGVLPAVALEIVDAATAEDALASSARLEPVWALFRAFGSLRVAAAIAEQLGLVDRPCLPLPLRGLDDPARAQLADALRGIGVTG